MSETDLATAPARLAPSGSSYRRILTATSMLGGAAAINLLVGMARAKFVAVLLGPAGVGLMGMYQSITNTAATFAGMGLNYSGVRELAAARGSGDAKHAAETLRTLRVLLLALGLGAAVMLAVSAWPISQLVFETGTHARAIAVLAVTVFIAALSTLFAVLIQSAQAMRRLALMNVIGALAGTALSVACFLAWGQDGIVPALLAAAAAQLAVAWYYARGLPRPDAAVEARFSPAVARSLFKLGGLMLFFGLLGSLVFFTQRLLILRVLDEDAMGIFQAAFSLSGLYAGYILGAMGTDFLPRLSAVAHEHSIVNRLVNEQTVVAMLLGVPGIVGTIVFAGLAVPLFYASTFQPAISVLQLMAVGVFGRLVSWPMGFVLVAKGDVLRNVCSELLCHFNQLVVLWFGLSVIGIAATGLAPVFAYVVHTLLIRWLVGSMTGFRWSAAARATVIIGLLATALAMAAARLLPRPWDWVVGGALFVCVCMWSLRQLSQVAEFPGARAVLAKIGRLKR